MSFRVRRWLTAALVGGLGLALVLPQQLPVAVADPVVPSPPSAPGEAEEPWVEPTGEGLVRPDWLSASVTARASGVRVEVLSERTASSRQWVHPDGVAEVEQLTGPVRFEDPTATETDGWRDIDTTLVVGEDGRVAPRAVPGEFSLSGGGAAADLLSMVSADGASVELGSGLGSAVLPVPVVEAAHRDQRRNFQLANGGVVELALGAYADNESAITQHDSTSMDS